MENEQNEKINFLDITIQQTGNSLSYKIYRKPTATSTIIHNTSCHPVQQKMSAIYDQQTQHIMNKEDKNVEKNTVKYIL
jgi:hypothetical protein